MITGITGHQDLGDVETRSWIADRLVTELQRHGTTLGLSSLAVGADQLFVDALAHLGVPYDVVVPSDGYAETFAGEDRDRYVAYLAAAQHVHHLGYPQPAEEAYFAAGQWIVAHCELLIAVWNGLPARGKGGTGDVVEFAIARGREWIHIDPVSRLVVRFSET